MNRFSKILNREISDDEIFEVRNFNYSKSYTDVRPNDTTINHVLKIKFKFDFSDLDSIGRVVYMEELENDHWNSKPYGIMDSSKYFFNTVSSEILKRFV